MIPKFRSKLFRQPAPAVNDSVVQLDDPLAAMGVMLSCARMFTGEEESSSERPMPEALDRRRLDYSLASLAVLDGYILAVHWGEPALREDAAAVKDLVVGAGGYYGETMRRNFEGAHFNWLSRDNLARLLGEERLHQPAGEEEYLTRYAVGAGDIVLFPLQSIYFRLMQGEAAPGLADLAQETKASLKGRVLENWISFARMGLPGLAGAPPGRPR